MEKDSPVTRRFHEKINNIIKSNENSFLVAQDH